MATHPLAQHPLGDLHGAPKCSEPRSSRVFLSQVMLENALRQCSGYVRGELLDVGCGRKPYANTYFAAATSYVGVDYQTDRSKPDIVASALELPLPDSSYDTVVSTEVLEHVPDPLRALREMHRVLRPGGHLILTAPMYWPRHDLPYDFFRYPYDGLLALLKEASFEIVKMFNRGRSYAYLGQVVQHIQPVPWAWFSALVNTFFLWCDRRLNHDALTMGWAVVARHATDGLTSEWAERSAASAPLPKGV